MVTVRFPVYYLERHPEHSVIVGSYSASLATKFSRMSRKIARDRFSLSNERASAVDWETEIGGGLRSVGVGGGITGHGGEIIIVDDPVKSSEEARSATYRARVWEWFRSDLWTRRHPNASTIVIMTRWHKFDLVGQILDDEEINKDWKRIRFPAIAESDNDILGRKVNEALWPERYSTADLLGIKKVLTPRPFEALYQQNPVPREGGAFKREWFIPVPSEPLNMEFLVRYWDKGGTDGGGTFSAGVLIGMRSQIYYIIDSIRGQWSTHDRENRIKLTAIADKERYGSRVVTIVEQEGGSGGKESMENTTKNLAGFRVQRDLPHGNKEARAEPLADQAEGGNVRLVMGPWNEEYLDELESFPVGKYRDQVDASSGAFNRLVNQKRSTIF